MRSWQSSRVLVRAAIRMRGWVGLARLGALLLALALVLPALSVQLAPATPAASAAPAGFAYRCGIRFCKDGRLFYFAGANTYDIFTFGGSYGDTETTYMDKARIDAHFANLQRDGVTVLRLWMFSHETWHGFEAEKGVYNEQQFALFDYIIESAKAHNVYLMPVFENYWEAYGGIDTRLKWEGVTGGHPGRWRFFNKSICPGCFTQYKNYVSYALNRVNHYSGVAYKDEPIIFAWDLMNEPRYQDATPNENSTGTTLRAWVDEMAGYVKSIDPNHMVGVGLEAHEARFGFGGDEGNPFIYIHQSPYIDMTSAHPYPDESWANLTIPQTVALVRQWITESHEIVGKPFYLGEFNTHLGSRSEWWTAIFGEMERSGGDGSGFWWYSDKTFDSKFGVWAGQPELAVFRQHSAAQAAKNVPVGPSPTPCTTCPTATRSPTRSATPTRSPSATIDPSAMLKIQYRPGEAGASTSQVKPLMSIVNISSLGVPFSELKARYWYTKEGTAAETYFCDYAPMGCGNVTGSFVKLASPVSGADQYLEVGFASGAGTLAAGGQTGEIQNRFAKSDWSPYTQTGDYSFDGARMTLSDANNITLYRAGSLVWGVEPGGSTPPTRTFTSGPQPSPTPTHTSTTAATATSTRTLPPATISATRTRTGTTGATSSPTSTRTPTQPSPNLLLNGGFETDANPADGDPDSWTVHANVTRSSALRRSGTYSIRHESTANNGYVISQAVSGITAGTSYSFSGYTNIPATGDTFTYRVELVWRNGSNGTISTSLVKSYSGATGGWDLASGTFTAPANTTNVVVRMNVSSLAAIIYSDDFSLARGTTTTPVPSATRTNTAQPTISRTPTLPCPCGVPTFTPIASPTGVTPTVSRTPTLPCPCGVPTFTATPTSPPVSGLRVQYRAADAAASTNQLKPWLNIVNGGTASVALSELKARYYYAKEGTANEQYFCDYAVVGCGNVTGSFAQGYLELGFGSGTGSLAAGAQTGEIQSRVAKTDWSPYTQTGDYSFDPTKTAFADWSRVTLYRGGVLVWGTPAP